MSMFYQNINNVGVVSNAESMGDQMNQNIEKNKTENTINSSSQNENKTWIQRNLPAIVGVGTFAALVSITILMYFANN